MMQTNIKMIETLANGYKYESTQRELSNEYQHARVWLIFKNLCLLMVWKKVASALEGLSRLEARIDPRKTENAMIEEIPNQQ